MASYRFCRTDDVALLVRAWEACYGVHDPTLAPLTVDRFRIWIRELQLWCSSCMVALEDGEPIAVLLAAKRERDTGILSIGVRPDRMRRGHARHLVTSLGAKLAILGPPLLRAEIPASAREARAFIEACGFRADVEYVDFACPDPPPAPGRGAELLVELPAAQIPAPGSAPGVRLAWERSAPTLHARRDRQRGLAVAAADRLEAWIVYEDDATTGQRSVASFGVTDPERAALWHDLLFRACAASAAGGVRLLRVHPAEVDFDLLASMGFRRTETTLGYVAPARPA